MLSARAVVIATGAQYKKPDIANLKKFEGQGIYYGATHIESQVCGDEDVVVVGEETPPDKPRSSSHRPHARFTCWCDRADWRSRCRAT